MVSCFILSFYDTIMKNVMDYREMHTANCMEYRKVHGAYSILPDKRLPPNELPPFFFIMANYEEFKESLKVSGKYMQNNSEK